MTVRPTTKTVIGKSCPKCGNTVRYRTSRNCVVCFSVESRKTQLKRNFGITTEEYDSMLYKQDGKCAICGTDKCKTGRRFSVDHRHDESRKIRGLLCKECNIGLGNFQDDPNLVLRAYNYLKEKL
jgi:hypothetical protein